MPKKLKVHPNERIDLNDFELVAGDYADARAEFDTRLQVLDRRGRVFDGFRIRIDDQSANPGQITVFNGYAVDRDGRAVHDESQENLGVTVTLVGASTTFYVELERVEVDTDTDSRSFWDPAKPNTDPIPDGGEASITVSTRKSHTWRVVQPVSTTGFDATTNPNSTRLPLAVLSTNASNEIDLASNPGLVQSAFATVTETSVPVGGTSLRVFDSRHLGTAGDTVRLGAGLGSAEVVTLTSNDVENGIIEFSPTANAHEIGEIVVSNEPSGSGFITEKENPASTSAHPDSAQRMWQGNEVRGGALAQSKYDEAERSDLNVRSLKDKLDLHDALIRELKFGAFDPSVTSAAPPTAFPTSPRYVDNAGSLAGARPHTVSIGDGTTSFGDYNGSDETPFVDAVAHLASLGGGTILVKRGTYAFTNSVSVTSQVRFVGEGPAATIIQNDVPTGACFDIQLTGITDSDAVTFEYFKFVDGTGADDLAFTIQQCTLVLKDCVFEQSIELRGGLAVGSRILADRCSFAPGSTPVACIQSSTVGSGGEVLSYSSFTNCTFDAASKIALVTEILSVRFYACTVTGGAFLSSFATTPVPWNGLLIDSNVITVDNFVLASKTDVAYFKASNNVITVTSADSTNVLFLFNGAASTIHIVNNRITTTWSGTTSGDPGEVIKITGASATVSIQGNLITVNSGELVDHVVFESDADAVDVSNNWFFNFYRAIYLSSSSGSSSAVTIASNRFDGASDNHEQHGVYLYPTSGSREISCTDNSFTNLDAGSALLKRGLSFFNTDPAGKLRCSIRGNYFKIGSAGFPAQALSGSIYVDSVGGAGLSATISNNTFGYHEVSGTGGAITVLEPSGGPSSVSITDNTFVDTIKSTITSGDVTGIHVNGTGGSSAVISGNSFSSPVESGAGANVACIRVINPVGAVVTNNSLVMPTAVAAPSTYQTAIYLEKSESGSVVSNNTIGNHASSNTTTGIHCSFSTSRGLRIESNDIRWGGSMTRGVDVTVSSSCQNLSVNNNNIVDIAGFGEGILVSLSSSTSVGIQVNGNHLKVDSFNSAFTGIAVTGGTTVQTEVVQINNNVVRNDVDGSVSSIFPAISVSDSVMVQINNNLLDWAGPSADSTTLSTNNCQHGTVIGNVIRPGSAGTLDDVNLGAGSDSFIVDGNILGSSTLGTGTIASPGADNLRGTDNTAAATTNKTS